MDAKNAESLHATALLYSKKKLSQRAEVNFKEAIKIYEQLAETEVKYVQRLATILRDTGLHHETMDNLKEAAQYFEYAANVSAVFADRNSHNGNFKQEDLTFWAVAANDCAFMYFKMDDWPNAEKFYLLSLDVFKTLAKNYSSDYVFDVGKTYETLGKINLLLKRTEAAYKYYLAALNMLQFLVDKDVNYGSDYLRIANKVMDLRSQFGFK